MTTPPRRPHFLLIVGAATLAGCGGDAPSRSPAAPTTKSTATTTTAPPPVAPAGATAPAPTWPMTVVDGFGRRVTIPRAPGRVVSLAPSNTELMFALGAGDRLAGRTTVCDYPAEAASVPAIGGMTPRTLNLEALASLRPDLILATCGVQEPLMAPLERLGLPVVALDADDFEGVARNVRLVGRLLDRPGEGDRLAGRFLDRIAAVRARVAPRPGPRPRVLYLVGEDPLMTAGPQTFIGRMIEAAGGTNIFADVATRYPRPSEEEILARDPEVILLPVGAMTAKQGTDAERRDRIAARPGWGGLAAVRDRRFAFLPEDAMSRPGLRLADGLEELARALAPTPLGQPK